MHGDDLRYLREHQGYKRLLLGVAERYRSLGRFGGTVVLRDLTAAEQQVLSWHFRRDYSGQTRASVSVAKFAASLADTRFAAYSLQEIVEAYLGQPLTTKQAELERFEREREAFFQRLRQGCSGQWAATWLDAVLAGTAIGLRRVLQAYGRDAGAGLAGSLERVCVGLEMLERRTGGRGTFSGYGLRTSGPGDAGGGGGAGRVGSAGSAGSVGSAGSAGNAGSAGSERDRCRRADDACGAHGTRGPKTAVPFPPSAKGRVSGGVPIPAAQWKPLRLPVFAAEVASDPHAFDLHTELGQILVDALCTALDRPAWHTRQDMLEVLYAAGVVGDEISNYVTCWGLLASRVNDAERQGGGRSQGCHGEEAGGDVDAGDVDAGADNSGGSFGSVDVGGVSGLRDSDGGGDRSSRRQIRSLPSGSVDKIWEAAHANRQILQVPLAWFDGLDQIWVPGVACESRKPTAGGQGFVVENAGVFSAILDGLGGSLGEPTDGEGCALICTTGQLKLAGLLLLDHLAASGAQLWYSGDFDPEGLVIAQKLVDRYGDQLRLWRYTVEDYAVSVSDQAISSRRLAMLDAVGDRRLEAVKVEMRRRKRAGYQEALVQLLVEDVRRAGG